MKKLCIISVLLLIAAGTVSADADTWSAEVFAGGSYSGGDAMGGIGVRVHREFGEHFEAGFNLYAQSEVSGEYEDAGGKEYHLSSGFSTLVLIPKISIGKRWEIALPIETGSGLLQYRYSSEYREELKWTEEILDQVTHSVYSIGIEPRFLFGGNGALTIAAGYLGTGPLRTELAEDGELNGFWARAGYQYRF